MTTSVQVGERAESGPGRVVKWAIASVEGDLICLQSPAQRVRRALETVDEFGDASGRVIEGAVSLSLSPFTDTYSGEDRALARLEDETMPPRDPTLSRDLSLAVLLAAISSLPLIASGSSSPANSLRLQLRDLVRTLTRAVVLTAATTGAVVLGGGAILVAERVYYRVMGAWSNWRSSRPPRSDESRRTEGRP